MNPPPPCDYGFVRTEQPLPAELKRMLSWKGCGTEVAQRNKKVVLSFDLADCNGGRTHKGQSGQLDNPWSGRR